MPAIFAENLPWVYVVAGLFGLVLGGEVLIRGSLAIAAKLKIPRLIVGLTIIGFGTSLPELLVSLTAAQSGVTDIAVGNVVGSNIANIALILGLAALLSPFSTQQDGVKRDTLAVLLVSALLVWLAVNGGVTRHHGVLMLCGLLAYMAIVLIFRQQGTVAPDADAHKPMPLWLAAMFVLGGLALLVGGADLLVDGASTVARSLGVSDAVIGLTLVAVGTSLPELTVTLISASKRQTEITLGNVLGSNIFNILGILGITAMVHPLDIPEAFLKNDIPVMAGTALLLGALVFARPKIGRLSGLLLLSVYAAYIAWLIIGADGVRTLLSAVLPSA